MMISYELQMETCPNLPWEEHYPPPPSTPLTSLLRSMYEIWWRAATHRYRWQCRDCCLAGTFCPSHPQLDPSPSETAHASRTWSQLQSWTLETSLYIRACHPPFACV